MLPATCHNLEFGRTGFVDFTACGCSFNSSFDLFSKRKYARKVIRSVSDGYYGGGVARRLICCRRDANIAKCRVFSTEAPGTLVNGTFISFIYSFSVYINLNDMVRWFDIYCLWIGDVPGPPRVLSEKKENTTDLFEVVSDDLLTLNKNLQSVSYMFLTLFN